jgi:hypothetical protein
MPFKYFGMTEHHSVTSTFQLLLLMTASYCTALARQTNMTTQLASTRFTSLTCRRGQQFA